MLLLVAAVALCVRFAYVARAGGPAEDYVHDDHDVIGINVVTGHGFSYQAGKDTPTITRAPLFPLVLGVTYLAAGHQRDFTLWRSVEAVVEAATAVLLALLVLQAAPGVPRNLHIAGVAGTLYALNPQAAQWATRLTPETWMTFFAVLAALAFVVWLRRASYASAALLGLTLGLLILTKSVSLGVPVIAAVAGALLVRRDGAPARRAVLCGVLVLVVAYSVVAPWTIRNYRVSHAFVPVQTLTWYNFWMGMEAGRGPSPGYDPLSVEYQTRPFSIEQKTPAQDLQREAMLRDHALTFVREHPGGMARKIGDDLVAFWYEWNAATLRTPAAAAYLLQLALAVAGVVIGLRRPGLRRLAGVCLAFPVYYVVAYSPFFAHFRFSLPTIPFTAALAAIALVAAARWGRTLTRPSS